MDEIRKKVVDAKTSTKVTRPLHVIPGKSIVIPNGDLYFQGNYTKDTGPTHVEYHRSNSSEFCKVEFEGYLKRESVVRLAELGCKLDGSSILVPTDSLEVVESVLKN